MNKITTIISIKGRLLGNDFTTVELTETLFANSSFHELDSEEVTKSIKNIIKKMNTINYIDIFLEKDYERIKAVEFYSLYYDNIEYWEDGDKKDVINNKKMYNLIKKVLDNYFAIMIQEYTEELRKKSQEVV